MPTLSTKISGLLESAYGGSIALSQSYAVNDGSLTRYLHPLQIVVPPLDRVLVNFYAMSSIKYLVLETDTPVDVIMITNCGPVTPPTLVSATFRIINFLAMGSDIKELTIYNPNGGTAGATIKLTAVGS